MRTIHVKTASADYPVHVGCNFFPSFAHHLRKIVREGDPKIFILTSPAIWGLWGKQFQSAFPANRTFSVLFVPAGEEHKRFNQVERLATELSSSGADRSSLLIAFGGGIIGDIGGFLAAIYMRGIDYIQMPKIGRAHV